MKYYVKLVCICHLILLGISSSLILSIRNRGWEVLRNRQHLFSMTKVICWWSLGTKQLIKTNKNTNKKLSTLVLICGSIAASSSPFVSIEASSPQHKSSWLWKQQLRRSVVLWSVSCFFQICNITCRHLRWNENRPMTIKNLQTLGPSCGSNIMQKILR